MKYQWLVILFLFIACNINSNNTKPINNLKAIREGVEYCESCYGFELALKNPSNVYSIELDYSKNTIDTLKRFDRLEVIYVNKLKNISFEVFLNEISGLYKLRKISIENTGLTYIPKEIGLLKNLESLEIKDTIYKISDSFYNLTELKELSLYSTDISPLLCNLNKLEILEISNPNKNSMPEMISCLSNLEIIRLHKHILYFPDLKKLSKLKQIDCLNTKIHTKVNKLSEKERQKYFEHLHSLLPENCRLKLTVT